MLRLAAVLLSLALAGCATQTSSPTATPAASTPPNPPSPAECTPTGSHEHAAFAVYIHNESIEWTGARWSFGGRGAGTLAGHVHQPQSHTIHMESSIACITLARFMRDALGSTLTSRELTLDAEDHDGRSVVDGEGGRLRFFLGKDWSYRAGGAYPNASDVTWTPVQDLPQHQPLDGEYLLITFGDEDDAAIAWQQRSIPVPVRAE